MESSYGPPLHRSRGEELELDSALKHPPEEAKIDHTKSSNIQNQGLNWETNKEWSLEAESHTDKEKELTGVYLEVMEGRDVEFKYEVSGGMSMPLSSTTISQPKAHQKPELRPDEWQAQSDTIAQLLSVKTPLSIANFVPFVQEEPKSQEEEWLCRWSNIRSRAALDSSRYASLFEEIEHERVLWPEGVDEKLCTWISRMDEQIRQDKELKIEMEAFEDRNWEVDWLVKEKICTRELKFDGKRKEVESESNFSGEGSVSNTRESKASAQSSVPSPILPLDNTASATKQAIFCFKEWNILFDNFRLQAYFLVSRSHALDQEINILEAQSRTANQLKSWIALMGGMNRERDVLKDKIVDFGEKVGERLRGLDVEPSLGRMYEEVLSRRIDRLKGILELYGEEDFQRLEEELEIKTRMKEVSRSSSASDPIDIALAETESSIIALLSTYRKAEISSINSALTAQPSPAPSDICSSEKPAFLTAADETKRALEDYIRAMKEEKELKAMREIRGVLGTVTRDIYDNSSTAKENEAIATGGDDQIPQAEEENKTTMPAGAEILNADENEARQAGRFIYPSATTTARETLQHNALWPWAVPLVYVFLTLLVRGLFWIFSFLIAESERESNPPPQAAQLS